MLSGATRRFIAQCLASPILLPGLLFVAVGLGLAEPPADMRLDEKMATVGLAVGSLAYKATAIAVGLIKISVPMNCWVIKSKALAAAHLAVALPGFALVIRAHRMLADPELPILEDIPCVVMPALLAVIALTPLAAAAKATKKAR